jgi:hypothetical protein
MPNDNPSILGEPRNPINAGGAMVIPFRANTPGAGISEQDLEILLAGSGTAHFIANRDAAISAAVTAAFSAICLLASANILTTRRGLVCFVVSAGLTLAALMFAVMRHLDARRAKARGVFAEVEKRVRADLKLSQDPEWLSKHSSGGGR